MTITMSSTKKSIATKSKKLSPASLTAQRAWSGFSPKLKKELRKSLPDTDRDKVPDGFDCRPRNRRRQESFLPEDAAYLNSNPRIEPHCLIGEGCAGSVFTVKDNDRLVVKVQRDYTGARSCESPGTRARRTQSSKVAINSEASAYLQYDLEHEPLFIPTKIVKLDTNGFISGDFVGLVRPRIEPIVDYSKPVNSAVFRKITDANLEEMRQKLIDLTRKGFAITDSLQVGIDSSGRLLLYDTGYLEKHHPKSTIAYEVNFSAWLSFLEHIGKLNKNRSNYSSIMRKYGFTMKDL